MIHTLQIDSVELQFGEHAVLQGAFLGMKTGEVAGLLGRNGGGKTCLLNIIFGTLSCQYRTLKIDDVYTTDAYREEGLIRYAPQFGYVPNRFTGKQVLDDFELDTERFLETFPEMEKSLESRIGHLSGGERRILEIYIVLASSSKFALLDEPFSQVMPLHIERIKSLIRREKENKGILVTDHMYRHILDISDRVYVISNKTTGLIRKEEDLKRLGYISWKTE